MKRFYGLFFFVMCVGFISAQDIGKVVDLRFFNEAGISCENTPNVCFDIQLRSQNPDSSFLLKGVNMRMFFDMAELEYESVNCDVFQPFPGFSPYQCTGLTIVEPVDMDFLGLQMPRYMFWNITGGDNAAVALTIGTEWTTVQQICFNTTQVVTDELCASLVWELQEDGDNGFQGGSDGVVVSELAFNDNNDPISLPTDEEVEQYNWIYSTNATGTPDPNPLNCITGDCVDPFSVDLISFDARKKNEKSSLLTWSTANEVNNSHFDVQRSTNGFNFEKIGEVPASEKQNALNRYDFVDNNPTKGRNYYRLKQVDNDGAFELTYIRTVDFFSGKLSIAAFPNPVSDFLYVDLGLEDLNASRDFQILLSDLTGKVLENKTINVDASSRVKIEMNKYAPGTYIIRVISGDLEQTEKIVKIN